MTITGDDLVALARRIATEAHEGQVDKAGRPYISHPERVAARVESPEAKAVAWLHDAIEDTDLRWPDLVAAGIPDDVIDAVLNLTRHKTISADDYYQTLREDPIALQVKLADIADNTDPARLVLLDEKTRERLERKYAHALEVLTQ